jgi:hypothetical protein
LGERLRRSVALRDPAVYCWAHAGRIGHPGDGLGSLIVAGILLWKLDPTQEGEILDALWFPFGWIGDLSYCLPIYVLKHVAIWV